MAALHKIAGQHKALDELVKLLPRLKDMQADTDRN
jgi:hypothetical protein